MCEVGKLDDNGVSVSAGSNAQGTWFSVVKTEDSYIAALESCDSF